MEMGSARLAVPEGCNVIIGHSHFIKTVEDLYETLVESGSALRFGIAFCEASGERLVRSDGNDAELVGHAERDALAIGAGHMFVIFIRNGYPVNVLNRIKGVSEVCSVYAATANQVEVVYVDTAGGRAIIGVADGMGPLGIEKEKDREKRRGLLRTIGYKR
jgi:adenosine/AMP kinase